MTARDATLPIVDPGFQALIQPLGPDERAQLEQNVVRDGCLDPLKVWSTPDGQVLLDGHNRLAICEVHGIAFNVDELDLEDRDAAAVWICENQLGRRNLTPYARAELVLKLKPVFAARAKARMHAGKKAPAQNSAEGETRQALARLAGVSRDTIAKVEFIIREADEPTKVALRSSEVSIHRAHGDLRMGATVLDARSQFDAARVSSMTWHALAVARIRSATTVEELAAVQREAAELMNGWAELNLRTERAAGKLLATGSREGGTHVTRS